MCISHNPTPPRGGRSVNFQLSLAYPQASTATYEVWPLRFEIDKVGRIWEVISRAVYTGRFDFFRELIQNSIDADLIWMYLNDESDCEALSPRRWTLPGYSPVIEVCYSEKERILEIRDNGIGMNRDSLQNFLFTVAETGYQKMGERKDRRFPSIAKFGIGFVSVLTRAEQVKIETRERVLRGKTSESGRRVWTAPGLLDTRVRVFDLMRPPQLERVFPTLPGPAFGSRSPRESNDGCTGS